jgi:hypothetical protein
LKIARQKEGIYAERRDESEEGRKDSLTLEEETDTAGLLYRFDVMISNVAQ